MTHQNAAVRASMARGGKVALALALVAAFMLPNMAVCTQAFADDTTKEYSHGTLGISSKAADNENVITLAVGETADVTIAPYQHVQYKGCDKPGCPEACDELMEGSETISECFTVGKGCICNGPAPALRTASVTATSSDTAIASASEATAVGDELDGTSEEAVGATRNATVSITGQAKGSTTVTVAAAGLRDWKDSSVTYTVNVVGPSLSSSPVLLRQAFAEGSANVYLEHADETWATAINKVTVAPVDDGVVGEAEELTASQFAVRLGTRWGDYIEFQRTDDEPIFTVDEFDKDPITVRTRWGGSMTYPQSQTYQITLEAPGYDPVSGQVAFYTGGSSTFSIIIDADGNERTTDDQTVAKSWTKDELEDMDAFEFANGSSQCGMTGFRTFSGNGISLKALLADAGVTVSNTDYFLLDTTDHYGNEFTYEELFDTTRYFMESIYTDKDMKDKYAELMEAEDQDAATIELRRALAAKAVEHNSTVEPRISTDYVETMLSSADVADATLPTADNTEFSSLIATENQFRFFYGLALTQDDCTVTFETGKGSAVEPQVVKSHLMTSKKNTTMKSSYWANSLVIYRNGAEAVQPSTAADKIAKPADPTREGYTFDGWFTDKACTEAFDFEANDGTVDADTTLYAKWTPKPTTVVLSENPVMLHQQFETGTASANLTNANAGWADAITKVTVAPVTDGVAGEAVELTADQYSINLGARWGDNITFNRTVDKPIFTVDEFDKDPVTVKTRWGGSMTYPQSKTYQVTIEANGYLTASAQIPFYTGGSSKFSIIVDADGDAKTTDDQTVAKSWTADEIKAMAKYANGSAQCGMTGYRTFSGKGVTLNDLLKEAGVEISESDYFLIDTTDHYGNEFTYEELFGADRYFLQSIYDDAEVQAAAAAGAKLTDETEIAAAELELRKLLAAKALEDKTTVEPQINVDYVETMIAGDQLADAVMPTEENSTFHKLIADENQFRFTFGLRLVQDEHVATFETGEGSKVEAQTVKSHLMTSDENTTMKSCYWANALVIYRNGAETVQPSTAADKISKPADPTRAGYTFGGWFTDEACTKAFNFEANDGALDADVTLYAKWNKNESAAPATPASDKPATSSSTNPAASVTLNTPTLTAKSLAAAVAKAGGDVKSIKTLTIGKKVKKIAKGAFKSFKSLKTLVVKSKKLTKKSVKGSLKGSKVKTIKVQIGSKKINKKFVKKYKKIFTKKNAGKKANVK